MDGKIRYRNTDLDLASRDDLTPLAQAFEVGGAAPLHVTQGDDGLWYATFERDDHQDEPESDVVGMLAVVESLPEPLRALWERCEQRVFDVGYDCGDEPWGFNQTLSPALLGRMAAAGASLRITIYPDRDGTNSGGTP